MRRAPFVFVLALAVVGSAAAVRVSSRGEIESDAPRAVDGLYLGLRLSSISREPYVDYITLLPDGRALNQAPDEGLAVPVAWERECKNAPCGTYQAGAREVRVRWSYGDTDIFDIDGAVLRLRGSASRVYRRVAPLDGFVLDGRYGIAEAQQPWAWITFTTDGRFSEQRLMEYTGWARSGDVATRRRIAVGSGAGLYRIRRNTLELRYQGGPTARFAIVVPPGTTPTSHASFVYINQAKMARF